MVGALFRLSANLAQGVLDGKSFLGDAMLVEQASQELLPNPLFGLRLDEDSPDWIEVRRPSVPPVLTQHVHCP
jgi:hypothetical protein